MTLSKPRHYRRLPDPSEKPLRVCHLGKYYPPASGGMETHVSLLARGQAELGVDVSVLCVNHLDRSGSDATWNAWTRTETVEESDGGVRVLRVGRRASIARFDVCPRLPSILRRLQREGANLFHLHTPNPSMVMALNLRARAVPLVVTHHSDVIRQKALGLALRPFEHRVYRRAGIICSDSPTYAGGSDLLQQYPERVRVLPLGIDLAPFSEPLPESEQAARQARADFGEPLWLCVGRLVYYKGIQNAIEALARVPGTLLIVGSGPQETALRQIALSHGVSDRVIWKARVDNMTLAGLYRAATALWFPSNARSEGFGLVQVEAMAAGCPVINAAVPHSGVAWVSPHDESGLTIPINDPAALAAAARRLLDEPGLRNRLADGARRRAAAEFDYRLMAERSLSLYRECLAATTAQVACAGAPDPTN